MNRSSLLVIALLMAPGSALADTVRLRDGRTLEGSVVSQGDYLVVRHRLGEVRVLQSAVLSVEERNDPRDRFDAARARPMKGSTAEERYRYGVLARAQGFGGEAERAFLSALSLDSDHAGARAALGYVRHEGRWISVADKKRLLGLVKYKGRWVAPEVKAKGISDAREKATARREAKAEALLKAKNARLARRAAEREARLERLAANRLRRERAAATRRIAADQRDRRASSYGYGYGSYGYGSYGYGSYGYGYGAHAEPIYGPKGIAGWSTHIDPGHGVLNYGHRSTSSGYGHRSTSAGYGGHMGGYGGH